MRKLSRVIGLALASAMVFSGCSNTPNDAGAPVPEVTDYLTPEDMAELHPEGGYELTAPEVVEPDGLPNRWVPLPDTFADSHALVEAITVGWNLGNTLDSNVGTAPASIRNNSPERQETHWNNVLTTEEIILMVRDAGFNAIRIPVTWFAMVDEDLNIREDWMDRVQEVVDYAYNNGMIVILNTHHDESMWSLFDDGLADASIVIETMWRQIAERFEPYGERLVFEGLNEPRTVGSAAEWSGGTAEERHNLNELQQVFVDTVRATGGNNATRFLSMTTYAASATAAAVDGLVMPEDPAGPGRTFVSIHMYAPYTFALSTDVNAVTEWSADGVGDSGPEQIVDGLDRAYETFVANGIPVIFGEMGTQNRNNVESRVAWADFYVREARERGMRTFWWDNGGIGLVIGAFATGDHYALFNRRTVQPSQPEIITAIMNAVDQTP